MAYFLDLFNGISTPAITLSPVVLTLGIMSFLSGSLVRFTRPWEYLSSTNNLGKPTGILIPAPKCMAIFQSVTSILRSSLLSFIVLELLSSFFYLHLHVIL